MLRAIAHAIRFALALLIALPLIPAIPVVLAAMCCLGRRMQSRDAANFRKFRGQHDSDRHL